ncbi:hypothetical protein R3P38DRAFT_951343 [Favolaschia claudopus]|uniref:Uncharacterized protein n=1 Tax=Favolaschia claudopus TaxID=2862362 RepID=A0AAW0BMH2_9AGAR
MLVSFEKSLLGFRVFLLFVCFLVLSCTLPCSFAPSFHASPVYTFIMPSELAYNALIDTPGGAFPEGGLPRDDFVAAARPVYLRIREHWSFHGTDPAPAPPPDSVTADEGLRTAWLPAGTRVVGVGGGKLEVRVPQAGRGGDSAFGWGRREEEKAYVYYEASGEAGEHPAHDRERCGEYVGGEDEGVVEQEWEQEEEVEVEAGEAYSSGSGSGSGSRESIQTQEEEWSGSGESQMQEEEEYTSYSDSSQSRERPSDVFPAGTESLSSSQQSPSSESFSSNDSWAEWQAHPEWECDGVQDVIFSGETDPRHGMAWHHYEYSGRVRPWDGLIGLIMRPRDRTLGLATYFISGNIVGRDTFEGTWQMAAQDVLAPSWGGSVCFARGED